MQSLTGSLLTDKEIVLAWSEASQNFQIKSERLPLLPQRIDGLWSDGLNEIYLWAERNTDAVIAACGYPPLREWIDGVNLKAETRLT